MRTIVNLCAITVAFAFVAGCSEKPSCKLLYKRYKSCESSKKKLGDLSESTFVELCEKLKSKEKSSIDDEIACSKHKDCDKFKSCVKDKRKARRAERMKERWKEAMDKAKKGDYGSALSFCRYRKDDLTDELKKECAGLAGKAFGDMMKDITAKRDAGKVDYKTINCWKLKDAAKAVGPDKVKDAETLCKEVDLVRTMERARKDVQKQLGTDLAYSPYYCEIKQVEKMGELGSPFAKKLKAELIELCFKKLGKAILDKQVPKMKTYCPSAVKRTYQGIKKYSVKDPDIDKHMEAAAKVCEK